MTGITQLILGVVLGLAAGLAALALGALCVIVFIEDSTN